MTAVFSIPQISLHSNEIDHKDCLFSILIPSWNNLDLLKICVNNNESAGISKWESPEFYSTIK